MSNTRIKRVQAIFFLSLLALPMFASSEEFGYIDCRPDADQTSTVPLFQHPCLKESVGELSCGQKVRLLGRDNEWLKVSLPGGPVGYVGIASVSKRAQSFITFDQLHPMKPPLDLAECSVIRARRSPNQAAELLVSAMDVSDKDTVLEADEPFDAVVVLIGFVGTDGRAHDLQVQQPIGNGLDEKARAVVQSSKFAPALKDRRAVSSLLYFDVAVRYTCIGGTARATSCKPFLFVESLRKRD